MVTPLKLGDDHSVRGLEQVANHLRRSKRVLMVTGAGVSCNAGIPDFRSEDGLYNIVKQQYPDVVFKGKDLFDSILFRDSATIKVFYSFMAGLRKSMQSAHPTPTHLLIKRLRDRKKLLRCYTQNIDGLEQELGLRMGYTRPQSLEVVQLHGDIHSLKCTSCAKERAWSQSDEDVLMNGEAPTCQDCQEAEYLRSLSGKRSRPLGVMRPNVVLYGEEHPYGEIIGQCTAKDMKALPDMLVIAGTSLKVVGIKHLVKDLAKAVRANGGIVVFVNQTAVSSSAWNGVIDYHVQGDTDAWVDDLKRRIPTFFMDQTRIKAEAGPKRPNGEPLTPTKPRKLPRIPLISPKIESDLLDDAPHSFGVFQVNPQRAVPIDDNGFMQWSPKF